MSTGHKAHPDVSVKACSARARGKITCSSAYTCREGEEISKVQLSCCFAWARPLQPLMQHQLEPVDLYDCPTNISSPRHQVVAARTIGAARCMGVARVQRRALGLQPRIGVLHGWGRQMGLRARLPRPGPGAVAGERVGAVEGDLVVAHARHQDHLVRVQGAVRGGDVGLRVDACRPPGWVRARGGPAVGVLAAAVVERPAAGPRRSARRLWRLRGAEVQGVLRGGACGGSCTVSCSQLRRSDCIQQPAQISGTSQQSSPPEYHVILYSDTGL